jgi:hypothetical protein
LASPRSLAILFSARYLAVTSGAVRDVTSGIAGAVIARSNTATIPRFRHYALRRSGRRRKKCGQGNCRKTKEAASIAGEKREDKTNTARVNRRPVVIGKSAQSCNFVFLPALRGYFRRSPRCYIRHCGRCNCAE